MDPRELLFRLHSRLHILQSLSLEPLYNTSTPILVISALTCTIIAYSIAKMFGLGSRNEFNVEGQVSAIMRNWIDSR
jgi:3-dehydrosphinganine reductase